MAKGRTVRIKVFKFDELNDAAKEKAFQWYYEIAASDDWWESVYASFRDLCKYIEIEVDLKKTYFNGFSHQGSGSSFTADIINTAECLRAIQAKAWGKDFNEDVIRFDPLPKRLERVVRLMETGSIAYSTDIIPTNREASVSAKQWYSFEGEYLSDLSNIEKCMEELEEYIQDVADTLNNWLYKSLDTEYEYITSREQMAESMRANEYEFTADGTRF